MESLGYYMWNGYNMMYLTYGKIYELFDNNDQMYELIDDEGKRTLGFKSSMTSYMDVSSDSKSI